MEMHVIERMRTYKLHSQPRKYSSGNSISFIRRGGSGGYPGVSSVDRPIERKVDWTVGNVAFWHEQGCLNHGYGGHALSNWVPCVQ